jgi:formamidopyrimidine-DNA glycosylase
VDVTPQITRRRLELEQVDKRFKQVLLRVTKLRLTVPVELAEILTGLIVRSIERLGKYLLFDCGSGCLVAGGFARKT